ncbi:MAG: NTP transferase domain-containing protein [Betaproteobacteria bacterium]|nr:NTP transferase domain-containing protein [Betaproteobacteria bacterium]
MKFGQFPIAVAQGVRLAHTLRLPGRVLRKGCVLSANDLADLRAAGIHEVTGARLATDESDEDSAAAEAAAIVAGANLKPQLAAKGRCNLKATVAGVLMVDVATINQSNCIDEALTIGTLPPWTVVRVGEVTATVKTIPFAVQRSTLAAWRAGMTGGFPLRVAPFVPHRAALICSTAAGDTDKLLAKTRAVVRSRIEALGSDLAINLSCLHEVAPLHEAIDQALAGGAQLIMIAGASVSKDRGDTVPAAIVAAGGEILHFGMPVEPGNMLLYARIGEVPVLNLPGCARSRRTNGLDWMLHRLLAKLPVSAADIMGMGVGGLIHSGSEGDDADELPPSARPARVAALVLAAGRSSRMGERNKLLCEVDGKPLLQHVVDAALASRCVQTLVVTGHQAAVVEALLADHPVSLVRNADYADGMASSLRCGLRALPRDIDGVIVLLADMPRVTATLIDRLLAALDLAAPAIIAPERDGRRGNPVLWPAKYFTGMMALQGDQGARSLLENDADNLVRISVDDDSIFADVDTPAELAALTET